LCCDALSIEQEAHARDVLSLAIAESVHQLAERGRALNLEEDLIVVVGDLDVQVFTLSTVLGLLLDIGRSVVRHISGSRRFWVAACMVQLVENRVCLLGVSEQVGRLWKCRATDLLVGRAAFIVRQELQPDNRVV
jgi:hypothetical protein